MITTMSPGSDAERAADQAVGLYRFNWPTAGGAATSRSRRAKLREELETAIARSVAALPDGVLEARGVKWVILKSLPHVLRLRFRRRAATTVCGSDFTTKAALGVVLANGDRVHYLIEIRDRRCRVSTIPKEQVAGRAEVGFEMRLPRLMKFVVGADIHPALMVANGVLGLWGDIFVVARLIPIFGIPTRSLLHGYGDPASVARSPRRASGSMKAC
ncbi:hypothetical protein ACWEV3_12445 [Saccharopolyspora sp. NPDC003752]